MSTTDTTVVRLERTFGAPVERVFEAWTSPEVLRRWWGAGPDWQTPVAEVDLRVGGSYRLSMKGPGSAALLTVAGRYTEVSPPELLQYTWAWEQEDGTFGPESTVRVTFAGHGDHTHVTIEHSGLLDEDARTKHLEGWAGSTAKLERLMEASA